MKKVCLIWLVAVFVLMAVAACGREEVQKGETSLLKLGDIIPFDPAELKIEGELGKFQAFWETEEIEEGLQVIILKLKSVDAGVPRPVSIKWSFPSIDVYAFWNTEIDVNKVNYYRNRVISRAASQAPVLAFLNNQDMNRFTVACSDALNKLNLRSYLREEDARFYCSVELFDEKTPAMREYTLKMRVDRRPVLFHRALSGVSEWWAAQKNYTPAPVPDTARMPMYSTWYSFHQNILPDEVVEECRLAKELGFEAVIMDDGWQTLDSQRGYAYTGDWKPVRLPEIKEFVDSIHGLGMKFLLWYSLPFVGEKAETFKRFQGKYLRYWEGQGAYVLDPRYPGVREHIIRTYEQALRDWHLDGFKLDFIGFFIADKNTEMTKAGGRDFASVNQAVDRLMTDIMTRLREIRPDIMIEFRQRYIGPLMRKYGNMFRAVDCPNNAVVNRARTTDLRLLSGSTAAHSDMFMWHKDEPVELAALQILNILFSVPQLSVRLNSLPQDQLDMIRFWIGYWKDNREVLLDGEFIPRNPGAVYPLIQAKGKDTIIIAVYNDMFVTLKDETYKKIDVINAKMSRTIILELIEPLGRVRAQIFDCKGNLVSENIRKLKKGVHKFSVPASGLISLHRDVS